MKKTIILVLILIAFAVKAQTTLNLKFFMQGYYLSGGMMQQVLYKQGVDPNPSSTLVDTAVVELRITGDPCPLAASFKGVFMTNGSMVCNFPDSIAGHSYWILVKHRNTVMTSSHTPVAFTAITNYDFSDNETKAYGNAMVQVGAGAWAFYSGDITQNWTIDLGDFPALNSDINHGRSGYRATDLDGDGNVDLADFPIMDASMNNGVFSYIPPCF